MYKFIKTLIIVLYLSTILSINTRAESSFDLNDLVQNGKVLDGQEVIVEGEAIGEQMERGYYSWVNINDGTNAIGIWIDSTEAKKISYYGNYKYIGDTVKITGIFNRACKEHGGEADVHYISMNIIKNGYQVKQKVIPAKVVMTVILLIFVMSMLIFYYKKIRNIN